MGSAWNTIRTLIGEELVAPIVVDSETVFEIYSRLFLNLFSVVEFLIYIDAILKEFFSN